MDFYYHSSDDEVLVIRADGGLNKQTAEQFIGEIGALIDGGVDKLIIDCERLTYISSYGLGILVRFHKKMVERGGDVKLAGVPGLVAQAMQLARLDRLLNIYPDVESARAAFGNGTA